LRGTYKYVKQLKTFRKNKALFNKRTNLIQIQTVLGQIAQQNDTRAKNNGMGQKEDPRNFQNKRVTENYLDLFLSRVFSH